MDQWIWKMRSLDHFQNCEDTTLYVLTSAIAHFAKEETLEYAVYVVDCQTRPEVASWVWSEGDKKTPGK